MQDNGIENCYFYKFYASKKPEYLLNLFPMRTSNYRKRSTDDVSYLNITYNFFKHYFSRLQLLNGIDWTLGFEA